MELFTANHAKKVADKLNFDLQTTTQLPEVFKSIEYFMRQGQYSCYSKAKLNDKDVARLIDLGYDVEYTECVKCHTIKWATQPKSPEVIGEHITEPFEPTEKLSGISQYNQYKNNGGSMSFTEWYRDGRYDPNLEPDTNNFGDNDFATPEHLKIV